MNLKEQKKILNYIDNDKSEVALKAKKEYKRDISTCQVHIK